MINAEEPNHDPLGHFGSIHTSKTLSADAGIVRFTVMSISFIFAIAISPSPPALACATLGASVRVRSGWQRGLNEYRSMNHSLTPMDLFRGRQTCSPHGAFRERRGQKSGVSDGGEADAAESRKPGWRRV